jgi:hypothetical protein
MSLVDVVWLGGVGGGKLNVDMLSRFEAMALKAVRRGILVMNRFSVLTGG